MQWKACLFRNFRLFQTFSHRFSHTPGCVRSCPSAGHTIILFRTKDIVEIWSVSKSLNLLMTVPEVFWAGVHGECTWNQNQVVFNGLNLKGKFPQTTMWIGWVESNFRNPTVKCWANVDNPFKKTNYAKFCIKSPSLDSTLPESVISQENNSPLTLYIEYQDF